MKKTIALLAVLTLTSFAHAGFAPQTQCSNVEGRIVIANYKVSIQTYKHPELVTEKFDVNDLDIKSEVVQEMAEEIHGCSSEKVVFKKVTIAKKDGSAMPSAYNKNAVKGVLTSYMICTTTHAWMPATGESCFK